MNRQQAFEAIYAKQHDVPAESLVQYRHKSKDGYNLPGIASHYRTYCMAMDSEEIEALRKDAERYRWLREKVGVDLIFGDYSPWLLSCNTDMTDLEKKTTDEAIDAAMAKGAKP